MNKLIYIVFFVSTLTAQTLPFKTGVKWGIKQADKIIINAIYDTVLNFDINTKTCLACNKTKIASTNKFIKAFTTVYTCNYLNFNNKPLSIKTDTKDTCSVFSLSKNSAKELYDNTNYFIVTHKSKKYLIDKNFNQITFNGYHNIAFSSEPNFLIVEEKQITGQILTGLINLKEEKIIDFNYSGIKINTADSLIITCTSGVNAGANDDVYDYYGKKINSFRRHIDLATKNFIVHKIFEPNEYYIVYNIKTKIEKILNAAEVKLQNSNELLIKLKNEWLVYDLNSGEIKPLPK